MRNVQIKTKESKKMLHIWIKCCNLAGSCSFIVGCGGNNGNGYNPPSTTGNIQFQNQTDDAYYVEVAGYETFTLGGNRSVTYSGYEVGRHHITVTQKNGYILYPTVKDGYATVRAGETTIFYWN